MRARFSPERVSVVWLHASPNSIADGDYVLPSSASGLSPHWSSDPAAIEHAIELGQYRPNRVSIFDSEGARAEDHIGRFSFVTAASYIYEVEPVGPLEQDPVYFGFHFCLRARVLSCLYRPDHS